MNAELALAPEIEISQTQARSVGRRALWQAGVFTPELGVNDPLTHLEQYLESGEAALSSIDEDLITDIAECRLKPTFVNSVEFDRVGSDFVSRKNKFSMRSMTALTESKFANGNLTDMEQYKRAKIEATEVERLRAWFTGAAKFDVFIAESLPLGSERYATVRFYEKTNETELIEHVISLHNASIGVFNELRSRVGADQADCRTSLDVLASSYQLSPGRPGLVKDYIVKYDGILSERLGGEYSFGLPKEDKPKEDDIVAIRRQPALRSVYLDTIRALGESGGWVTEEVAWLNSKLGGEYDLILNTPISTASAGDLLDRSLQSVVATFNRAPMEQLTILAASGDSLSALASAARFGGEARAEGVRYEGACPSGGGAAQNETAALAKANGLNKDPSRCGTCPKCRKQYYVEEKVYKARILECNNCHAAIRFGGRNVSRQELDRLRGRGQKSGIGFLDGIMLYVQRLGLEAKIKETSRRQQADDVSDFERRRGAKLLGEYNEQLAEIEGLIK